MPGITRMLRPLKGALHANTVLLSGRVSIAADATTLTQHFTGGTWTRVSAGLYRLTLDSSLRPFAVASVHPTFMAAVAVNLVPQLVAYNAKTGLYDIRLHTGGVATDPAAACEIHLLLVLVASEAPPQP